MKRMAGIQDLAVLEPDRSCGQNVLGTPQSLGGRDARSEATVETFHQRRRRSIADRPPGSHNGTRAGVLKGPDQAQEPLALDPFAAAGGAARQGHDLGIAVQGIHDLPGVEDSVIVGLRVSTFVIERKSADWSGKRMSGRAWTAK